MIKSRKMQRKDGKTIVKVTKHIILQNFWEYYIVDDPEMEFPENSDVQYAYAIGVAQEFGTISMSEMKPYIISETTNLNDVAPAPKWEWIDD
tara:strand:+ start:500 stop:775 length:276 start_codon:yes stop_codon:yes gene_type:complete